MVSVIHRGLDESGFHRHVDRLRQEFFHPLLAQQPAKLHQRRGVARPAMFNGSSAGFCPTGGSGA